MWDYQLLDMYEFGINGRTFQSMESFKSVNDYKSNNPKSKSFSFGSKPALLFQGESFENDPLLKEIRKFFIDYFNGEAMKKFNMATLDHVIVLTLINLDEIAADKQQEYQLQSEYGGNGPIIMFRHYKIEYQSSSHNKLPFVHLSEIGPSMDLMLRRFEKGNDEIIAKSKEQCSALLSKRPKQKNVALDSLLKERRGRIWIETKDQNVNKLKTKKMKALRDRDRSKNQFKNNEGIKRKKNSNNRKNRIAMGQDV